MHYRSLGAEYVAVYFDPTIPPRFRQTYQPMFQTIPVVEHGSGPWFRQGKPCDYVILSLREGEESGRAIAIDVTPSDRLPAGGSAGGRPGSNASKRLDRPESCLITKMADIS